MSKTFKLTAFALLCAATVIFTSSCASMFGDNTRQIAIKSQPSGAAVYINGINTGTTPTIITLPTYIYGTQIITLRKKGYEETSTLINSKFQMVGLWNLINGWGFIIDAADGNMMKIDPAQLNIERTLTR